MNPEYIINWFREDDLLESPPAGCQEHLEKETEKLIAKHGNGSDDGDLLG